MSLGVTDPSGKAAVAGTPIDSTDGDGTPIKSVTNRAGGRRLLRFDNPNKATELRLGPFDATVDASATSPEIRKPYPGYPGYYYTYHPKSSLTFESRMHTEFDPRSVNLTRSGASEVLSEKIWDATAKSWKDNPDLIKTRDEWVEGDGTGHGHTRFSYLERVLTKEFPTILPPETNSFRDDPVDVVQSIRATRSGWPTDLSKLSWNWTYSSGGIGISSINALTFPTIQGNALNDPSGFEAVLKNPFTGQLQPGWYRVPSQGDKNVAITYDLTDATDGATAKAKYFLTLHDEWENPTPDDRKFPLNAPTEKGVTYEEQYYVPTGAISATKDTEATWSITQTTEFSVELKAFFEASFGLSDWGKAGGSMEAKRSVSLQNVLATQAGKPKDIYADAKYGPNARFLSVVVYQAKRIHKLVDHFGNNGFLPHPSTATGTVPLLPIQRSDPRWGKTPQSKIDSLSNERADWWPYVLGQSYPAEGGSGQWFKSGQIS